MPAHVEHDPHDGKFLSHVTFGDVGLVADEPVEAGGLGAGPNPYDLLAAALGACTTMTLRLYADRKRLPVTRITCDVDHRKVHADDCDDCVRSDGQARTGLVDRFQRRITVEGAIDDEARARLLEIADRCPVHRTLENGSVIVTEWVESRPPAEGATS